MHGLRHPVLPQRLPARQPDPGVERPGLPLRLGGGRRPAARHQQLPRVHRPALPGAVRVRVRARHQRRTGDDQAGRGGDHRPGVGVRRRRAAAAGGAVRVLGRGGRLGTGRARRGAAADPGRAPGHRLRARRRAWRAAALRHPRVQDGKAPPGPPDRPDGGRRDPLPVRRAGHLGGPAGRLLRGRAGRRRAGAARPAGAGPLAGRHPPGDGVPAAGEPARRVVAGHRARASTW